MSEELLDIKQAAALLNVTETSLRRWTDSGRLACLRVGLKRERRFHRADLLAFLENQPATVSPAAGVAQITMIGGMPVEFGAHLCAFYQTDAARTKLAVGFLADGTSEDNEIILLGTPPATRAIMDQLEGHGGQGRSARAAANVTAMEYRSKGAAQLEALEQLFVAALRRGRRSLRVVGTEVGPFGRFSELMAYEDGYEGLSRRFPVVTLCQYDARTRSGVELCSILQHHADVFRYPVDRLVL
ncbi:MAG TPA: MEDS domain-containing protein [Polyangiaceae bacterium]|nr:MEDS domain-containing protein [Polyangiaceae bacterium]